MCMNNRVTNLPSFSPRAKVNVGRNGGEDADGVMGKENLLSSNFSISITIRTFALEL